MRRFTIFLLVTLALLSGCRPKKPVLIVYTDPESYMTGSVLYYYGIESKTSAQQFQFRPAVDGPAPLNDYSGAAATAQLIKESQEPVADAYWSGDPVYCEMLSQRGLTIPAHSMSNIPPAYRDHADNWVGFAPRVRVLLVRSALKRADRPTSIRAYTDPAWKGRGALSDPLKGNLRSQFAALSVTWGDEKLAAFYKALRDNQTQMTKSDEESADIVAEGDADFALVTSDVALTLLRKGLSMDIEYPDQGPGDLGTMLIPNAVAVMKGCKNLDGARKLVSFLTSTEGERRIIRLSPWQIPFNEGVGTASPYMRLPGAIHVMPVDYPAAARKLPDLEKILGEPAKPVATKE
ncbi:MAG TPA: extracellular solute-binding protein [Candidatus Sulfopaludibacter sp.]|jgi:iron(III) transport system substrate-binding protein|nr:extracellular solute-binding protein [Candidatus Sulfopaludibacter sp.]